MYNVDFDLKKIDPCNFNPINLDNGIHEEAKQCRIKYINRIRTIQLVLFCFLLFFFVWGFFLCMFLYMKF